MKTQFMKQSEHKLLSEFDPPPLLETTVVIKDGGLKRRQTFYVKEHPRY